MKEEMATQLAGSGHDARDSTARRRHDGGQWPRRGRLDGTATARRRAVATGGEQLAPLPLDILYTITCSHIQIVTQIIKESIEVS